MSENVLLWCIVLCVNSAYLTAAFGAAKHYRIGLDLSRGAGLAVLYFGTIAECGLIVLHFSGPPAGMLILACGAVVVGAACDAACGYVFDALTLPSLLLMLIVAVLSHATVNYAYGVAVAGGSLALLYAATGGRGLGLGDVKLASCIGGATGALGGAESLGIAFVLGGAYASYLLVTKRARRGDRLRFAPYLAAGMALVMLHGGPV